MPRPGSPPTPPPRTPPGELLQRAREGDTAAATSLFTLLYESLHYAAQQQLRGERIDHTLQPTALVHEVYLRLVGGSATDPHPWNDAAHFFAAAATSMRHILIDHARAKQRIKRGGGKSKAGISLDAWESVAGPMDLVKSEDPDLVLSLNDAIRRLEEEDPEVGEVVRLRFFAGLNEQRTAQALGVSDRTVRRHWAFARAWLFDAVQGARREDS